MKLQDFLPVENVVFGLRADSKTSALRQMAEIAAKATGLEAKAIAENLIGREELGSTGIGNGIAIPHARIAGLKENVCFCAKLAKPVEFEAVDEERVNLIVLVLSPVEEGRDALNMLSCVARRLRNDNVLAGVAQASSADELYSVLTALN